MRLAALILAASLCGCSWFPRSAVDAVVIADRNADLAISVLVAEWERSVKPTLPADEAAAFQARLDAAIERVREAQARALDAARANNWRELTTAVVSTVADVVALVDKFRASKHLPVSDAQRYARARLESMK
jgi:hypothetical protein